MDYQRLLKTENEHEEQKALIQWFRLQYPRYAKCLWAIPNGGGRHIRTAVKLKDEGVLAGVSDLFLMVPINNYHGMFIEMKTRKGKPQKNQKDFLMLAQSMGYSANICYGFEQGKAFINSYLQSRKGFDKIEKQ